MKEILNNIYYLGVQDPTRRIFDELVPLPDGTNYNSYLIVGSQKTVLIDTNYSEKIDEFLEKLSNVEKIDYVVCQHAEQDHSSALVKVLEKYPEAKVLSSPKCAELLKDSFSITDDRFEPISDNQELSLGDKTLQFILAPFVHWPDTIFTYLKEDNILFTCDFLGAHIASDELYSKQTANEEIAAKRYFAEIMMPFAQFCKKYVAKIRQINPSMILPSHGLIHKKPEFILDLYDKWTDSNPTNKAVVCYISMYSNTKQIASYIAQKLEEKSMQVELVDLSSADTGDLAMMLVDADIFVLGSSMVLAGAHPVALNTAYLVSALKPKIKKIALVGSYGWGGNLFGKIEDFFKPLKAEVLPPVTIKGSLKKAEDFALLEGLVDNLT